MRLSSAAFFLLACCACVDHEPEPCDAAEETGEQIFTACGHPDHTIARLYDGPVDVCPDPDMPTLYCHSGQFSVFSAASVCCESASVDASCIYAGNPGSNTIPCPDGLVKICDNPPGTP
jgi:hypothetical protein